MSPIAIQQASDARVADYRAIPDSELLRARGLFVAEGRLVVRRLLESRRFRTRSVLVSAAALEALGGALDAVAHGLDVFLADADTISAIGSFNFHRGCLAIGERPSPQDLDALPLGEPSGRPVIVLIGLTQADNVGSVFRNAAAFGAAAVLLDDACCDPLYRKALRTSMGTVLELPYARTDDPHAALDVLRRSGYRLAALTPRGAGARAIDEYAESARHERIALLVGAEGPGLPESIAACADDLVSIPMSPGVDSLNVATATGIALHRLWQPLNP
jgi:tRNA G18 (ribose-2'-O)-methylase SpoU